MFVRHIEFDTYLTNVAADTCAEKKDVDESITSSDQSHDEINGQTLVAIAKQTAAVVESIYRSLQNIEDKQRKAETELVSATVELSMLIAENITRRVINADEFGVEELVAQAIARVTISDSITIYLNPADKQLLETRQVEGDQRVEEPQTKDECHALSDVNIQIDRNLNRGDCYVDAGDIGMLTTLEQHLTDIRQWLLEGLDNGFATGLDCRSKDDEPPDSVV